MPIEIPTWVIVSSALMLGMAVICAAARFAIGPRTPDRIVAFDLFAGLAIAGL